MLSKHEDGYRYIPQLGDEVVYLRQAKSHEFPDSPWLRYKVQYENDDETHLYCPWELREPSVVDDPYSCEQPHIDSESKEKLLRIFSKLQEKDLQTIQQLNQAVEKADFCNK
ncbi:hypothetical protein ACFX2A_000161 [Malus domestica]